MRITPVATPRRVAAAVLDVTRATRSHCGGTMRAALLGATPDGVVAVDLTKGIEALVVSRDALARALFSTEETDDRPPLTCLALSRDGRALAVAAGRRAWIVDLDEARTATRVVDSCAATTPGRGDAAAKACLALMCPTDDPAVMCPADDPAVAAASLTKPAQAVR